MSKKQKNLKISSFGLKLLRRQVSRQRQQIVHLLLQSCSLLIQQHLEDRQTDVRSGEQAASDLVGGGLTLAEATIRSACFLYRFWIVLQRTAGSALARWLSVL